ncbi:MAG: S8 family serine peptidase, partial [Verrucomicrobiota bacterium]
IISYVPNNAYLVKGEKAAADQLASAAGVQAVLPFEPYYKLSPGLLKSAVEQEPLSDGTLLRLTLIPGERTKAIAELRGLKAVVLSEESSPFGPQVVVQPELTSLAKIAQMSSVQGIEPDLVRMPANDLSRIALGIATNGSASNYLNLTGSNIWVNFNDEGIDTNYAGLKGRVFLGYPAMGGTDVDGHGTFVAGMIAGDGSNSPDLGTNSFGSDTNANFRGIAPMAKLFGLPLDSGADVYPKVQDTYLIETAARSNYLTLRRTNTLISNNSWTYGTHDYDSSAARYDAAVRDAIPGATGSQPLLFVFAAGNSGFGNDDGTGGEANTIESPATAKNVITVGALEQARFITNSYVLTNVFTNTLGTLETNMVTNFPFAALTDTSDSVANFSSRGNVGAGFEGNNGRFKPDVVAPGTMIISARSSGWNITNVIDTNTPLGQLYADLHGDLKEYRFDSGSTFAAANISGTLALIQEYYETQAPTPLQGKLSPALMKGLLINGSRSLSRLYDIAAQNFLNHQGWGLPSLPAVFPSFSTNAHKDLDEKHWRLRYVDQSPTNALATGQSRTWNVRLATNASGFPLRVTLVWTDPPGNPNVGVKLVNDLDLIITNLDTKVVWFGNNIPVGNDFTEVSYPDEGDPIIQDAVNNVENIIIGNPFQYGQRFSITVRAKRVNVNSVNDFLARTGNTNDVTQDFALIVSSDIGEDPSLNTEDFDFREEEVFTEFDSPKRTDNGGRLGLTVITNGLPLLSERVGANASLVGTNGITNQWNFYVFTNVYIQNSFVNITNGSNVAFVTFDPPNLARPRNLEADIDLYVSKDPGLTNLEPAALASAFKSTERGGTEMVVFTNATVGAGSIYYVAVKSEDQQAAEFSLIGISSDVPFDQDQNGQRLITAMPFSSFIPDGSASKPAASTLIGIGLHDRRVQRIIATNTVSHENLGDLVGILRHSGTDVILNNHTLNNGNYIGTNTIIYNDYDPTGLERHTDGPGSLNNFAGTKITGPWFMYMIDNSPSHTGRVELLTLLIKPLEKPLIEGVAVTATIDPNQMLFYPIDVPPGVTNLTFRFTDMTAGGTLEAYLRRDELPTTNIYELKRTVTAPGGVFTFPTTNNAALTPGTYFLALRNPGGVPVTFTMTVFFDYEDNPNNQFNFTSAGPELFDDVSTNATLDISEDKLVGAVQVGVRMGHPRVSDTVLRLVTPQGSSILLQENRGQTNGEGIGSEYYVTNGVVVTTNTTYTIYTDDTNVAQLPIKFTMPPYQDNLAGKVGVILTNGFEGVTNGNYLAGRNVAGWTVLPNKSAVDQVSILSGLNYSHSGTNALSLGTGIIATNITTVPGRSYRLVFAYRGANQDILYNTGVEDTGLLRNSESSDVHYVISNSTDSRYQSGIAYVFDPKPFGNWLQTNKLSGWVAPYPVSTTGIFTPDYFFTYRTYVDLYGYQSTNASVSVKIASDNDVADTYLNGKSLGITTPVNSYQAWSAPIPISGFVPGLNVLEFRVRDFGPPTGFRLEKVNINAQSITNSGVSTQAIANVMISGIRTNTVVGSTNWRTRAIDFVAKNTTTQIRFAAEMGELWLDSVQVEASGNIYVLPEEPLASVQGERAIGQWKLELLDNKTGAEVPLPELLSWKLDLIYADPLVLA